jgi:hypothetical protein
MAQLFKLAGGVDSLRAHRAFAPRPTDQRSSAEWPAREEDLARFSRVNVLVVGSDDEVAKLITSLWPCFGTPVVARRRGEPLRLSPTLPPVRTAVVYDVDTLTGDEQRALNEWMTETNGARVVSTASESLLPMVNAGAFNDALYYRLNVVMIDLRTR